MINKFSSWMFIISLSQFPIAKNTNQQNTDNPCLMAYHSLLRRKINSTLGQATSHQFQLPTFILAREFLFFIFFWGEFRIWMEIFLSTYLPPYIHLSQHLAHDEKAKLNNACSLFKFIVSIAYRSTFPFGHGSSPVFQIINQILYGRMF